MQQIFCPLCGTGLAATARFCGSCGNAVETEKPAPKASTEPVASRPVSHTQPVTEPIVKEVASTMNLNPASNSTEKLAPLSAAAASALKRYQSAYRMARLTDMAGHLFKAIGVLMGIGALVIFGFGVKTDYLEKGFAVLAALFVAGLVFLLFFAAGLILSAQGQSLKANLDSAVNSSPFLTDEQRARAMLL